MSEERLYAEALKRAHDAPMAQIYETHKGEKFIGVHTDVWWKASREAQRLWELRRDAAPPSPEAHANG